MVGHKSFGRRGEPQRLIPREKAIEAVAQSTTVESTGYSFDPPMMLSKSPESSLLDDDLREWKRARKRNFEIPWRPLSLMATLCFGIASFVLPDTVNDTVQWFLYALMAASFYVGIRRRRQHSKT
jgi:hypothetical protein